ALHEHAVPPAAIVEGPFVHEREQRVQDRARSLEHFIQKDDVRALHHRVGVDALEPPLPGQLAGIVEAEELARLGERCEQVLEVARGTAFAVDAHELAERFDQQRFRRPGRTDEEEWLAARRRQDERERRIPEAGESPVELAMQALQILERPVVSVDDVKNAGRVEHAPLSCLVFIRGPRPRTPYALAPASWRLGVSPWDTTPRTPRPALRASSMRATDRSDRRAVGLRVRQGDRPRSIASATRAAASTAGRSGAPRATRSSATRSRPAGPFRRASRAR